MQFANSQIMKPLTDKDLNFQTNKEEIIRNLKLQESLSNEVMQMSRFGERKTSPLGSSFVSDSRTPLKLLHYHKKKDSV